MHVVLHPNLSGGHQKSILFWFSNETDELYVGIIKILAFYAHSFP